MDEMINTELSIGSTVIMKHRGNTSGNPLTTGLNSFCNFMFHYYAFTTITGVEDIKLFLDKTRLYTVGDDAISTVSPDLVGKYNYPAVAKILTTDFHQKITTADKHSTYVTRPVTECEFLKRKFKLTDQGVVGPLATTSIEKQFNYTKIDPEETGTFVMALSEQLLEACVHGEAYYNHFCSLAREGLKRPLSLQYPKEVYEDLEDALIPFESAQFTFMNRYNSSRC